MTPAYAFLVGVIFGIAVGLVILAFSRDDRIAGMRAERDQAREDAADARARCEWLGDRR